MKKLIVLAIVLLLVPAFTAFGAPGDMQSFCSLATPQTARVFDWSTWETAYVEDQNLYFEPFSWDATRSIWQGYNSAQPFNQPDDAFKHWSVTLLQANGAEQWIYVLDSQTTPDTNYIYVFDNVDAFADRNGNHYGFHPCAAFAADATVINDWLTRVYSPTMG